MPQARQSAARTGSEMKSARFWWLPCAALFLILAARAQVLAARAQDSDAILRERIPQCTVRGVDGFWIPGELYADGVLRFTYLYEAPKENPGEYDYKDQLYYVYAAFWNRTRTKGELLQFVWLRRTPPIHLRIVNHGHIIKQHGKMEIEKIWDTRSGVWGHELLMRRLARLKTAPPETVSVREISPVRGAICDSDDDVAEQPAAPSARFAPPRGAPSPPKPR